MVIVVLSLVKQGVDNSVSIHATGERANLLTHMHVLAFAQGGMVDSKGVWNRGERGRSKRREEGKERRMVIIHIFHLGSYVK